jgi:hypothetical protein
MEKPMKIDNQTPVAALPRIPTSRGTAYANPATAQATTIDENKIKTAAGIMQKYNLRNASADEVQAMGKELYAAGAIDGEQMLAITAPLFEKMDMQFNRITDTSAKRDYLQSTEQMLTYAKTNQTGDKSTLNQIGKLVNYFHNLASLREA